MAILSLCATMAPHSHRRKTCLDQERIETSSGTHAGTVLPGGRKTCLDQERIETTPSQCVPRPRHARRKTCLDQERIETLALNHDSQGSRSEGGRPASIRRGLKPGVLASCCKACAQGGRPASIRRGLKLHDAVRRLRTGLAGRKTCLDQERIETCCSLRNSFRARRRKTCLDQERIETSNLLLVRNTDLNGGRPASIRRGLKPQAVLDGSDMVLRRKTCLDQERIETPS